MLLSERQARMTLITVLISCTQDNALLPIAAVALVWCCCQYNIYVWTCVCLLYLLYYCTDDDATHIHCSLHTSRCFLLLPQQTVALYLADRKYSYIIYLHTHTRMHTCIYVPCWMNSPFWGTCPWSNIRRKLSTRIFEKNLSQFSAQWNIFESRNTNCRIECQENEEWWIH